MRKLVLQFISLLLVAQIANAQSEQQEVWRKEMRKMKEALSELLPYAAQPEVYNAPDNAVKINKLIRELSSSTKALNSHREAIDGNPDPTLNFVAEAFENSFETIEASNAQGRRGYARFMVLNATSYCIECHTRTSAGIQFINFPQSSSIKSLKPVEKTEYLMSVRQFQEALTTIEETLKQDPDLPYFGTEKLVRYGVTVAVRFLEDPKEALKILKLAATSKNLPYFLKVDMENWEKALLEWQKEKAPKKPLTQTAKIAKAEKLINKAQAVNAKAQSTRAGEVYLLRANSLLLGLFKTKIPEDKKSRILFLIGESYRLLPEHLFWSLHEAYYEACIRSSPHTLQAQQCFRTYEEALILGYSGSAGTHLPLEVVQQLKALRELAKLKTQK